MPHIRKLPSGKHQANVRHPSGKRITKTFALKRQATEWGRDLEAQFRQGDLRDPRAGHITVAEWYSRWYAARGIESVTKAKIASIWATHCEPQWGTWPMDAITAMEAQEWANRLRKTKRARHLGRPVEDGDDSPYLAAATVREIVDLMSSLYLGAMKGRPPIVLANPFADLDLPRKSKSPPDFLDHDEAAAIIAALRHLRPDEPWHLYVEMGTWMGLRLGELAGLPGSRIGWLRHEVQVQQVMTRHGLRAYPKTDKSFRTVPMPRSDMVDDLAALFVGRDRGELTFRRPEGGPVDDSWFRQRVWVPALKHAKIRPVPPRIMRHTAASWLIQDGVPLEEVQVLLGHESITTTQIYAHLKPGAHEKVRESWRRTSDARAPRPRNGTGPA